MSCFSVSLDRSVVACLLSPTVTVVGRRGGPAVLIGAGPCRTSLAASVALYWQRAAAAGRSPCVTRLPGRPADWTNRPTGPVSAGPAACRLPLLCSHCAASSPPGLCRPPGLRMPAGCSSPRHRPSCSLQPAVRRPPPAARRPPLAVRPGGDRGPPG